jgi:uncharacterized protein YlxW (UPF0749 family)
MSHTSPEPGPLKQESAPRDVDGQDRGRGGRHALLELLRPRASRGQAVAALLLALLGFALAVQLRSTQEQGLSSLRQQDLVRILDDVSERSQRLQTEVGELEATKQELAANRGTSAIEEARKRADTLAILAGTAPAEGPGIELTIFDPRGGVQASRLLDAVQELRDAGAEAIQLGSVRVVASTYFVDTADGIEVDGVAVSSPYRLMVIGDTRSLSSTLDIPGGILEVLRQNDQADAMVTPRDLIKITALHVAKAPHYASPAPEPTGKGG